MEYTIEQSDGYFVVNTTGVESEQDIHAYIKTIIKNSVDLDCKHVLLDETRVLMKHDAGDDLEISMSDSARALAAQLDRIACVGRPERYNMILRFELFAQKRGLNFRGFKTIEEAVNWLTSS